MKKRAVRLAVAALMLAALRALSAPPWPDDWDGVGFVLSVTRFDLARFTPHPPGYPVYVAMLRCAALVLRDPVLAANGVSVLAGTLASVAIAWAALRALDPSRAKWIAAFATVAPLAWRAGSAVGSESAALLFACVAVLGATTARPGLCPGVVDTRKPGRRAAWLVGASVGLGLGVRLSWAPLFVVLLALAPRGERVRASVVASLATLAWAIPFVAIVGPAPLVALMRTHAVGHFETWGGTALTDPGLLGRADSLARDLFVDGLGVDHDPLGLEIGVLSILAFALALRAWRASGWVHARLALVPLPYLAWIALGQNVREQPRHALPLVVLLAAVLGLAVTSSRGARVIGFTLLASIGLRTTSDAFARRTIPPAGEQLVAIAESSARDAGPTAVYGGPSARFFELDPLPGVTASTVATLGDARLALGRLPSLPARVLVTSELRGVASSREVEKVATLCRPERIDRRAPCLDVYAWSFAK